MCWSQRPALLPHGQCEEHDLGRKCRLLGHGLGRGAGVVDVVEQVGGGAGGREAGEGGSGGAGRVELHTHAGGGGRASGTAVQVILESHQQGRGMERVRSGEVCWWSYRTPYGMGGGEVALGEAPTWAELQGGDHIDYQR